MDSCWLIARGWIRKRAGPIDFEPVSSSRTRAVHVRSIHSVFTWRHGNCRSSRIAFNQELDLRTWPRPQLKQASLALDDRSERRCPQRIAGSRNSRFGCKRNDVYLRSFSSKWRAALISPRCVNACGKLPSALPVALISSE
jgi:hypothetical protein